MSLSKMLQEYREGLRGLPTYEELAAISTEPTITEKSADQLIELAGALEVEWLRQQINEIRAIRLREGPYQAGWETCLEELEVRCGFVITESAPLLPPMTQERFNEKMDALDKANPAPLARLMASSEQCADPIVERNVSLLRERSTVGVEKYGTTLADNKLPLRAWLNHALEEALDQANYLQAAMAEIDSAERALPPLPQYFPDVTNIRADEELRAQQYAQDYARSALASVPVQTGHFPQRDQSKPAEQQGVFQRFDVLRTDGSRAPGGRHHNCRYFALDVDHDALAKPALQAYATACATTHPDLSADMVKRFDLAPAQEQEPYGWDCAGILVKAELTRDSFERDGFVPVALYSTPVQAVVVPDGWKMVPVEPTDAMAVAAIEVTMGNPAINGVAQYRAMIAAAPVAQPEVRKPIMWAALNMNGKVVCVNQDKSACDVERLCIKTPTTIAPLYAGASEPQ